MPNSMPKPVHIQSMKELLRAQKWWWWRMRKEGSEESSQARQNDGEEERDGRPGDKEHKEVERLSTE